MATMHLGVSPNSEIWKEVITLDNSYIQRRVATTSLTQAQLDQYLQFRRQLSNNSLKLPRIHPNGANSAAPDADRTDYLLIRKTLLSNRYSNGIPSPANSTTNKDNLVISPSVTDGSSYNVLLERYQRSHQLSVNRFSASSLQQLNAGETTTRSTAEYEAPISKDYAFAGIETIFDHHKDSVTRIRFAHNDSQKLAIASSDGTASICHISGEPTGHRIDYLRHTTGMSADCNEDPAASSLPDQQPVAVMDITWSSANDCLATVSLDGSVCLWTLSDGVEGSRDPVLTRRLRQRESSPLLVCEFHPINNNYLVIGDSNGVVQVLNLSTGRALKHARDQLHRPPPMRVKLPPCRTREDLSHRLGRGCITALAVDPQMSRLWVGTDQGLIQAYTCSPNTGRLTRTSRLNIAKYPNIRFAPSVTCISYCAWLSQDDSTGYCLVNAAGVGLLLFTVNSTEGELRLEATFGEDIVVHSPLYNPPTNNFGLHMLHSCFAPLISFRPGGAACAVTASEEGGKVIIVDITGTGGVVTCLQGHNCVGERSVIDVALSWDESILATADEAGLVILWKRR